MGVLQQPLRPGVRQERLLHRHRPPHGVDGVVKGGGEGVAVGADLVAAVDLQQGAQNLRLPGAGAIASAAVGRWLFMVAPAALGGVLGKRTHAQASSKSCLRP
jgi:hypothetical protein